MREEAHLERAFAIHPDYLQDTERDVNLGDRGLQLTRSFRALKLWWSLRAFGVDAFRTAVEHSLELAAHAARLVERAPAARAARAAVARDRLLPAGRRRAAPRSEHEAVNAALVAALEESGTALATSTRVRGTYALRLCVMNDTCERADVERVVGFLGEASGGNHPAADARDGPSRHRYIVPTRIG